MGKNQIFFYRSHGHHGAIDIQIINLPHNVSLARLRGLVNYLDIYSKGWGSQIQETRGVAANSLTRVFSCKKRSSPSQIKPAPRKKAAQYY
jgi:hypothetical protein